MATEAAASYIDSLLKRVAARGARLGIRFESGAPVRVADGNGGLRDVTNRTLSPQEIMAAIAPIVPDAIKRLPQTPSANFNYDCAGVGAFTVALRRDGEKISVAIDPADAATAADLTLRQAQGHRDDARGMTRSAPHNEAGSAPKATQSEPELVIETTSVGAVIAANGPAAAGFVESVSAPNNPVAQVPVTSQQSSAPVAPVAPVAPLAPTTSPPIDRLFRLMCEAKASDLHLSVGMKPLVRKDGEIKVLDESAPAFDVESITSARSVTG